MILELSQSFHGIHSETVHLFSIQPSLFTISNLGIGPISTMVEADMIDQVIPVLTEILNPNGNQLRISVVLSKSKVYQNTRMKVKWRQSCRWKLIKLLRRLKKDFWLGVEFYMYTTYIWFHLKWEYKHLIFASVVFWHLERIILWSFYV